MLDNWNDRPEVSANLMNPAFCCEVIKECAKGYKGELSHNFPFSYSVLVLPFIIPSRIRMRLPKSKATTFHSWLNDNEDIKIDVAKRIKGCLPFTKEAIMFGIIYNSIRMDDDGCIEPLGKKGKSNLSNDETNECLNKALLLGKMLSKAGDQFTVYSMLGIKP